MTHYAIFERANDGRIWSRFVGIDGIVGNGATVDEARDSLLTSIDLAIRSGEKIDPIEKIVAVQSVDVKIPA